LSRRLWEQDRKDIAGPGQSAKERPDAENIRAGRGGRAGECRGNKNYPAAPSIDPSVA